MQFTWLQVTMLYIIKKKYEIIIFDSLERMQRVLQARCFIIFNKLWDEIRRISMKEIFQKEMLH